MSEETPADGAVPNGGSEPTGAQTPPGETPEASAAAPAETPAAPAAPPDGPDAAPQARPYTRGRRVLVGFVIGLATLLGILAILSVWVNRLMLNPDNWANTSTQLLQNPDIRSATSNYIVDQIYQNVDVAQLIQSGLPPRLDPLAAPVAGALRNAAVKVVDFALERPRVQDLWTAANRAADQTFVTIVEGGKGPVGVQQGTVTLDLASIIDNVAARLGLPPDLGAKLPPSVGHMTIIHSDQLKFVQNIGSAIKGLALILTILVPLLYLLAILLARNHRRKTLMTCGFAIVFAGAVALFARHLLQTQITNSLVHDATNRPAVSATLAIGTSMITEIAGAFIFVGLVSIAAAWFAGPARLATEGRRAIAPYLRDNPVGAFAVTVGVMVLVFIWNPIPATGKPAGMIVFLALALFGTELLRRQTAEEFPDARAGEAGAAFRGWLEARRHHDASNGASPGGQTLPDQLERLHGLLDKGAISQDEYDSAKANLLKTSA
jgi:hypothetical protein